MYGRLGLYHLHLSEALAQRRRLAVDNTDEQRETRPCPPSFKASNIILGFTVATLGILLTAGVVIRVVAAS